MIQALSKQITEYMFRYDEGIESFEIHQYGIEVILSTLINILVIIIIGLASNRVIEGIIYCVSFYIIRKFSGGYHCSSYARCISMHVVMFIIYLLTFNYYEKMTIYINIISLIIFLIYVPVRNRELTHKQYQRYKYISLIIIVGYMLLAYITPYTSIMTYIIMIVSILIVVCIQNYEENIT